MQSIHKAVLLQEVIQALGARGQELGARSKEQGDRSTEWYLDCTLGGAGHALAVAEAFRGNINIIGLDRDKQALDRAKTVFEGKLAKESKLILENEDFRNLDKVLEKHGIGQVDFILMDLGISSDELDNSGRGFTFQKDEPLLMTMGDPATYVFTAKDIVNKWEEAVLADIIFGYGEEKYARRIAKRICDYRTKKLIETSAELAEIVKSATPAFYRRGKIHPATRTFQALRIAVNDELNALRNGLNNGFEKLNGNGGRMAVISFHSLEDRIVKEFFKNKLKEGANILTKKPVTAGEQEILENPRARSAKLRVVEKQGAGR